ncbi:tyrosine-type recombinase/integrase [Poriferisphaera sp. WC338]|uniref:tyrosine-type recombinase/integrase n=1 Tax=Poriferisphaera sp. WC338 TaxID=3425129 RepID=UPI003D814AC9
MGITVRQKTKGPGKPWHLFVHHDGIIRSKKIGSRMQAEAAAREIQEGLALGRLVYDTSCRFLLREIKEGVGEVISAEEVESAMTSPRFADYAKKYMEQYAKRHLKRNTYTSYQGIIDNHLLGPWGNRRLNKITRRDVIELLREKSETLKHGTVYNIRVLISGIFTYAVEEEVIANHPALRLGKHLGRLTEREHGSKHINPMNSDQVGKLLRLAQFKFPMYYPLLLCAFRTGMRMGELLGLAWSDIDFKHGTITVRRSYSHGHFSTTKSKKNRRIDMSTQLSSALLKYQSDLLNRFCGSLPRCRVPVRSKNEPNSIQLVFPNEIGKPIDGDNLRRRVFHPLLKELGVAGFRFHDIRHTFASQLLENGEPINYVKDQMGHASITTTVDTYGHSIRKTNPEAVNKLDDAMLNGADLKLVGGAG